MPLNHEIEDSNFKGPRYEVLENKFGIINK